MQNVQDGCVLTRQGAVEGIGLGPAGLWASSRTCSPVLLFLSLALLALSTTDNGSLGQVVKLCWLGSFAALAVADVGAGFAVYISSLAIYSPLRQEALGSLHRPDNYAALIFFALLVIHSWRRARPLRFPIAVALCLAFFIVHGILVSPEHLSAAFRDLVIPALACGLLAVVGVTQEEFESLVRGLTALAVYLGVVSILQASHGIAWMFPPWLSHRSLIAFDEDPLALLQTGVSAGTLMEPAFHGLLLSLIVAILLISPRRSTSVAKIAAIGLAIIGIFLTYERGPWLGIATLLLCFPGTYRSSRQALMRRVGFLLLLVICLGMATGRVRSRLGDSDTVFYRLAIWGAGVRLAVAHPLVGVGFFNFAGAMSDVQQGFGSVLPEFREVNGDASHNTLITIAVEFGVPGLILCGTAFLTMLRRARRGAMRLWGPTGPAWIIAFALVYLVNAQFISAFEGTTNTLFCGVLGALAGWDGEAAPALFQKQRSGGE